MPQKAGNREGVAMSVRTFEAVTDDKGNIRFNDVVHLPAHTKVYVVVPEETTPYAAIVPEPHDVRSSEIRFPLVRVDEEGLAKRLVKTIIEDDHANL
jgi:hypothetical protein